MSKCRSLASASDDRVLNSFFHNIQPVVHRLQLVDQLSSAQLVDQFQAKFSPWPGRALLIRRQQTWD